MCFLKPYIQVWEPHLENDRELLAVSAVNTDTGYWDDKRGDVALTVDA